jgi:hypothetical protein
MSRIPNEDKMDSFLEGELLGQVCPLVELLDLDTIAGAIHVLPLAKKFANRFLEVLSEQHRGSGGPGNPEFKGQAARSFGRFFARIQDDSVRTYAKLIETDWKPFGALSAGAIGVAIGLAERSTSTYLKSWEDKLFPCLGDHEPLLAAARIIASRDALDAIQLIDRVPPKYFVTRASICGVIAVQMHAQRRGNVQSLCDKLSRYVEGATFQDAMVELSVAVEEVMGIESKTDEHPICRARALIRKGEQQNDLDILRAAVRLVDDLLEIEGKNILGETIFPRDLRKKLSAALVDHDPKLALSVILPHASLDELRPVATRVLRTDPSLGEPRALIGYVQAQTVNARTHSASGHVDWTLSLALALELPELPRESFISLLKVVDPIAGLAVGKVVEAESDPLGVLATLGRAKESALLWAAQYVIRILAAREPHHALTIIWEITESEMFGGILLTNVARGWPLRRWRSGIDAIQQWRGERPLWAYVSDATGILLERAAAIEPLTAAEIGPVSPVARRWSKECYCGRGGDHYAFLRGGQA